MLHTASSICFVGDSITEGTKNGGYGWFEPLAATLAGKTITRYAKGAQTSRYFMERAEAMAQLQADLYVVAVGCNDIRYRKPQVCAMNAQEYVENLLHMTETIARHSPKSQFIFIAPWMSLAFDANFKGENHAEKIQLYNDYTTALKHFCKLQGHVFVNANPFIFYHMKSMGITVRALPFERILTDFIHPTATEGIQLYSRAFLQAGYCAN